MLKEQRSQIEKPHSCQGNLDIEKQGWPIQVE